MTGENDVTVDDQHCSACGGVLLEDHMTVVCNGRTEHATCHRMHAPQSHPTPREYDPVLLAVALELCEEMGMAWGFAERPDMVQAARDGQRMLWRAREEHSHCLLQLRSRQDVPLHIGHGLDAHLPRDRHLWA